MSQNSNAQKPVLKIKSIMALIIAMILDLRTPILGQSTSYELINYSMPSVRTGQSINKYEKSPHLFGEQPGFLLKPRLKTWVGYKLCPGTVN